MTDVALQHLLGKNVVDRHGHSIGGIEEVVTETVDCDVLVKEYYVGSFALFERLSAGEIGRTILRFFGATRGEAMPLHGIKWT